MVRLTVETVDTSGPCTHSERQTEPGLDDGGSSDEEEERHEQEETHEESTNQEHEPALPVTLH